MPVAALRRILFIATAALLAGSPGHAAIPNGIETSRFPEVTEIRGDQGIDEQYTCSGVWLSPTTLLTAAHCLTSVRDPERAPIDFYQVRSPSGEWLKPARAFVRRAYNDIPRDDAGVSPETRYDLGVVLVHPGRRVPGLVYPTVVSAGKVQAGERVWLVGYGENDADASSDSDHAGVGVKRVGTNRAMEIPPELDGIVQTRGFARNTEDSWWSAPESFWLRWRGEDGIGMGERVSAGRGDSGGGLYVRRRRGARELAGILVSRLRRVGMFVTDHEMYDTFAVDLGSASSQAFLKQLRSQGAELSFDGE